MKTDFYLLATYVEEIQLFALEPHLDVIAGKGQWNFDLEDGENVLRLHCDHSVKEKVIHFLRQNQLFDRELHYLKSEQFAHISNIWSLSGSPIIANV